LESIEFISYISFDFLLYLCRWIISAFVMMIPLWFINKIRLAELINFNSKYKEYFDLLIIQIIGSFIFWRIDQLIFK